MIRDTDPPPQQDKPKFSFGLPPEIKADRALEFRQEVVLDAWESYADYQEAMPRQLIRIFIRHKAQGRIDSDDQIMAAVLTRLNRIDLYGMSGEIERGKAIRVIVNRVMKDVVNRAIRKPVLSKTRFTSQW